MDFEFDKEMDTILRQTARSEAAFAAQNPKSEIQNPKSEHLDADEISAFAENALPLKMRVRATEHLADCARCRKIFSNLISLGIESQSETIRAAAGVEKTVAAPAIPWHKRLFAFPQLSYAVGALALVFAAAVGFVVLQSRESAQNSSVARIEETAERPLNGKGASSDGETAASETFSSNASSTNTTANSNTATSSTATNANKSDAPAQAANSNASAAQPKLSEAAPAAPPSGAPKPEAKSLAPPAAKDAVADEVTVTAENRAQTDADAPREAEKSRSETQNTYAQNQQNIAPDSRSVQRSAPLQSAPSVGAQREMRTQDSLAASKRKAEERRDRSAETRSVGNKTFRRADGVWYDANYRNQPTTNVRRSTDEYKKLDARLRQIAENLGGVVVIIWGGNAYRIQ